VRSKTTHQCYIQNSKATTSQTTEIQIREPNNHPLNLNNEMYNITNRPYQEEINLRQAFLVWMIVELIQTIRLFIQDLI